MESTVTLGNVQINFTLAPKKYKTGDTIPTGKNVGDVIPVELSDKEASTNYMKKGIYIENTNGAASFKTDYVAFAAADSFLTEYTVTAEFDSGASTEGKTSLVGKSIYGAAVTTLAPADTGKVNRAELCTVLTGTANSAGDRTVITTVAQDYLKLTVNADLTIEVGHWSSANSSGSASTASKVRVQARYTDATGKDIISDHAEDKVGVAANASLTVA